MRIVTWNMGCGPRPSPYRKHHDEAWTYLLDELRPDVAFVQEALVAKIDAARHDHSVTVCELEADVKAGTAVLVRGLAATPAAKLVVSPATYAVTSTVATPAGPLVVVSVHVYPGDDQHADLARLVEVVASSFAGMPVLVGGDFNAARRFDEVYRRKKNKFGTFFEAMASAGFHEVHWALHGREVQSFWGRQTKEAYQDDHFFVTKSWATRVRSCDVIDNERVRRVSDHGPVMLDLDVS